MTNWIPTHGIQQGRSYAELEDEIKRLEAELKTANIKIVALNKLIQVHQTYQAKQGDK